MSAAQLAEYKELMHTFHVLQSSDISTAAAMSWVAYDIVLTFGEEIEFIWKAKWSLPKCLYIAARYYGLITLICATSSQPIALECILQMWSMAMVHWTSSYHYLFCTLLATSVGIVVIKQTVQFSKPAYIPITGCYNKPPAHVVLYAWIPSLVIAWIFYGLTVYRLFKELKIQSWFTLTAASGGDHAASMIHIFFRDGSIWFGFTHYDVAVVLITVVFQAVGVSNYYTGFKCFNFSHRDPDSSSIFGQHPNRMQIWIPQVFLMPHSKQETISKWQGSQGMTPLKIWISQDMMIF
ncbi:predicted protein [Postia placenta Mad-698-R]|nr:predicted protein [Postia placenta Mad-698-R]